jgi:hypothetical protein
MKKIKRLITKKFGEKVVPDNYLLNNFYGFDLSKQQQKPVNKEGEVIPWYTYPAIEYLEQFDFSKKSIFEWGSGNSSLYFSKKANKVTSIEHDKDWYDIVSTQLQKNQLLHHVLLENYPAAINRFNEKFDVIIIDGQRRFDCVMASDSFLKDDGMIILDNSDWFYLSAAYLREKLGLLQVDFHGFGPINDYTWTTSVFFTQKFNFPSIANRQPKNPKGGLLHDEREILKSEDKLFHTKNLKIVDNNFNP